MEFHQAEPTENLSMLRLVSAGGRWELGLWPVLFGVRVRAGVVGEMTCAVDYCAGANVPDMLTLLHVVRRILEGFGEDVPAYVVERALPVQDLKPVFRDPVCWPALRRLANLSEAEPGLAAD